MDRFFISHPIFAISVAVMIVIGGLISLFGLPVEQYPDITPPVVEVTASYEGADASTVDATVATPLAQAAMGVDDLLYLKTTSSNDGVMTMQLVFAIGSDPDMDALFTQNNISTALPRLPEAVTRQGVTTRKTMTDFLMVYSLHSDGRYDDEFLSNYAFLNLRDELLKIDGVGKVSVMGAGEYAMRIWLKPDVLKYYDIPVGEVISAVEEQAACYPAGQFGAEPSPGSTVYTYTVAMPRQPVTAEEFRRMIIRTLPSGEQIRLEDVASVDLGSKDYNVRSSFEGKPTALVVIYQQPGSNAMNVGAEIKEVMHNLEKRLPDGVSAARIVDSTTSIKAGVEDIFRTLLIALGLVILIIWLFLQDWRATVIPLMAIPVSLIGAFVLFPLLGFSINIISLLGMVLAIGLVVDDAIVVVEAAQINITRGMAPREAAVEAMRRVRSPILATTVVLLAVFLPVSFMSGITGLMFQQFSVTIAVSVVISAFNALTLSPALCGMMLRSRKEPAGGFFKAFNRRFGLTTERYGRWAGIFSRHAWRTGLLVGVIVVGIFFAGRSLPVGFLPVEDQGYVMVMVSTPEASSLHRTEEAMARADELLRRFPEVESTSYAAGFDMMEGMASTNSGVIFVALKDFSERRKSAMELAEEFTSKLYFGVPSAMCYAFTPPSIPGMGVTSGVEVEVEDLEGRGTEYLVAQTRMLIDSLKQCPSIGDVSMRFSDRVPQRKLVIKREQALAMGVDLGMLYNDLATLLGGRYIGNFTRFDKLYQIYLQAAPDYRVDRHSLDAYYVHSSKGDPVPLATLVEVRDTVGVEYLSAFNLHRSISLTVTPAPHASLGKVMDDVKTTGLRVLPSDVATAWSGVSFEAAAASKSGVWVYVSALLFVFLVLAALYESWSLPWAVLLSVPIAVLGALGFVWAAHWIDPKYINDIYMQVSLVMLIGLAAKNAILVVEYAEQLRREEGLPRLEAAVKAARIRLRPIVMTALAFILGVMPLVFADGVYASARNIMGVALVGGMLLALLVGVFFYPALYYMMGRKSKTQK